MELLLGVAARLDRVDLAGQGVDGLLEQVVALVGTDPGRRRLRDQRIGAFAGAGNVVVQQLGHTELDQLLDERIRREALVAALDVDVLGQAHPGRQQQADRQGRHT